MSNCFCPLIALAYTRIQVMPEGKVKSRAYKGGEDKRFRENLQLMVLVAVIVSGGCAQRKST